MKRAANSGAARSAAPFGLYALRRQRSSATSHDEEIPLHLDPRRIRQKSPQGAPLLPFGGRGGEPRPDHLPPLEWAFRWQRRRLLPAACAWCAWALPEQQLPLQPQPGAGPGLRGPAQERLQWSPWEYRLEPRP